MRLFADIPRCCPEAQYAARIAWYRTHRYQEFHVGIPSGLRLLRGRTEMLFFEHVGS